jgi:hypothetical protein
MQEVIMAIIRQEAKLDDLYIIDTFQFNLPKITSVFCWFDGEKALLLDCGTSDNSKTILSKLQSYSIPLEKLVGVVPSHYHFDHGGGSFNLWKAMKEINPSFTIYTNPLTKMKLQNPESQLKGASTTFGKFVGTMEPPPDEAFTLVKPDELLPLEFKGNVKVKLVHTPGHTPDHCSPSFFCGNQCLFSFAAESCGTTYRTDIALSTASSMPPNFSYDTYMKSFEKICSLSPEIIGLCHFGLITGEDVAFFLNDHKNFMQDLKNAIISAFKEDPSTAHVMQATEYLWRDRFGAELLGMKGSEQFFGNLRLALTYGIMVDLNLRPPKYEERLV